MNKPGPTQPATLDALREKALKTLEFDRVLEMLAEQASFEPSRELALGLKPSYSREEVLRRQAETRDAIHLLEVRPTLSLSDAKDIRTLVEAARLGGGMAGLDLVLVARTLAVLQFVQAALLRYRDSLPVLASLGEAIGDFRDTEQHIRRTLNPQGEVLDSASDLLRRVRSEEKIAQQRLNSRLQEIASSPLGRQVLQEPFITTRDGRYVLAVKADQRGQVPGLIHDISSSGATVFMEPLAAVELGNAWRELGLAERNEVERILRELSSEVGDQGEAIEEALSALAEIGLALAKAQLAVQMKARLPGILDSGTLSIPPERVAPSKARGEATRADAKVLGAESPHATRLRLQDARHPLLKGKVVPITLELGKDFQGLIISGPNTGGKTVALKTVGLLALMAQAGLAVPAEEGTAFTVFDGIFADIGDEQSIQQSLSTFSSHMRNIVQVLKTMSPNSLVLLDELGAGTDPLEGAALAKAVLSALVKAGAVSVVTTHHSEMKAFAHSHPGLQNANVEFDPVTFAPTYRLVVGLPGRSNAISIAESLGLPREVVAEARGTVGSTEAEVDALLRRIQEERHQAEQERIAAQEARKDLENTRAELMARVEKWELENRSTTMVRRAEVQVLAEEAKSQLRQVARRINTLAGEKGKKEVAVLQTQLEEVRKKVESPVFNPPAPPDLKPREKILPGQRVMVQGIESAAEVVSGPDRRRMVEVQVGGVRMKVSQDKILGKDKKPVRLERSVYVAPSINAGPQVGEELWVHGLRAAETVEAVREYLEKASLAGHTRVRIVHGKGRGILRTAIHEVLRGHPLVRSFRDADREDGAEGVTVVEL